MIKLHGLEIIIFIGLYSILPNSYWPTLFHLWCTAEFNFGYLNSVQLTDKLLKFASMHRLRKITRLNIQEDSRTANKSELEAADLTCDMALEIRKRRGLSQLTNSEVMQMEAHFSLPIWNISICCIVFWPDKCTGQLQHLYKMVFSEYESNNDHSPGQYSVIHGYMAINDQ